MANPAAGSPLASLLGGPPDAAARGLLGCLVRAGGVEVRLTEVEAYAGEGEDPASHAHQGPTARNSVMFGPPGYAYVYFIFGMHWCVNVVCDQGGRAAAVLLRAGEVVDGLPTARARRDPVGQRRDGGRRLPDRDLARGPARLAVALGVDGTITGTPVLGGGPMTLLPPQRPVDPALIEAGPRVGVAVAAEVPWRFWLRGEPTVSVYRRHVPRARQNRLRAPLLDEGQSPA